VSSPQGREAAPETVPRWAARWGDHPAGPALLALFAAMEACVFPAPTEALMVALSLGRPGRSWRLAALAVCASLAGALAGYAIGRYFLADLAGWVPGGPATLGHVEALGRGYRSGAFWLLATSGYTPVPYLAYTIGAGAYGVPLLPFVAGALTGRALKYFLLGTLTFYLGPPIRTLLARHARFVPIIVLLGLLGLLVLLLLAL
jgi:membrane protein YqaA with SNARE-associated domain